MPLEPFMIADPRFGVNIGREPWRSPKDSFREMENLFLLRGRIRKRPGQAFFGGLGTIQAGPAQDGDGAAKQFTYTLAPVPVAGSVTITADVGGGSEQIVTDDGNGNLIGAVDLAGNNTVNYTSGAIDVTFAVAPLNAVGNVTTAYHAAGANPVKGIWRVFPVGIENLIAVDAADAYLRDVSTDEMVRIGGGGDFTGGSDNLFSASLATQESDGADILVVVNGLDVPKKINTVGPAIANMGVAIKDESGTPTGDSIETAEIVLLHKQAIIYLVPTVNSVKFTRRAHWTSIGLHETPREFNFADAPTQEEITSAVIWRDRLFVRFNSTVRELRWTNDTRDESLLFEWVKVSDAEGGIAKNSEVKLTREVVGMSSLGPAAFNGQDARLLAERELQFINRISPARAFTSVGERMREHRSAIQAYPIPGAQFPTEIFQLGLDDFAMSIWSVSQEIHSLGKFSAQDTLTVDEMFGIVDDDDSIVDSRLGTTGDAVTLMGTETGLILKFLDQSHDMSLPISVVLKTQAINPFLDKDFPEMAHFGRLQIYMDAVAGGVLSIEFFQDDEPTAYRTATLALDAAGTNEKIFRGVAVNTSAMLHTIRLSQNSKTPINIDALILWMEPAGKLLER